MNFIPTIHPLTLSLYHYQQATITARVTFYYEILNYHPSISLKFYQGHILPWGSEEAMTRLNMALMKVTSDFAWS